MGKPLASTGGSAGLGLHWPDGMVPTEGHRYWGDGLGDGSGNVLPHKIADLSFGEGWVTCTCGETIHSNASLTLEDVWDVHRGHPYLVRQRAITRSYLPEQADDEEVHDFLVGTSSRDSALRAVSYPLDEFDTSL